MSIWIPFFILSCGLLVLGGLMVAVSLRRQHQVLAYNRRGEEYQSWQMWDDAVRWFDAAVRLDRTNALSHYNLGFALYFGKNQADAAQKEFEEAIKLDDTLAGPLYALGHLLLHKRDAVAEAQKYLLRALAVAPNLAEAHNTLALIDIRNQDWQKALENFRAAVSLNDRYDAAVCNLSIACIYQGRLAEAIKNAERFAELQPLSSGSWKNLGNMYGATGQRDKAILAFGRSLSLDSTDWIVHFWTGCLHLQLNQVEHAVRSFHEALRLHGPFALAHYNLALCYERLGDQKRAISHLNTALELNPSLGTGLIKEESHGNH